MPQKNFILKSDYRIKNSKQIVAKKLKKKLSSKEKYLKEVPFPIAFFAKAFEYEIFIWNSKTFFYFQ